MTVFGDNGRFLGAGEASKTDCAAHYHSQVCTLKMKSDRAATWKVARSFQ